MTRIQKILWSILCGTAIGMAGCGDDGQPEYGAPVDVSADDEVDSSDAVDPAEEEGTPTEYGPVPDF